MRCADLRWSAHQGQLLRHFRRALRTDNLTIIRAAAAELPAITLEDALSICLLVARQEARHFERAALRWIARYCLEPPIRRSRTCAMSPPPSAWLGDGDEAAAVTLRRLCLR